MKIAFFGTVGAGKSSIINKLSNKLQGNYEVVGEPLERNPYWDNFYNQNDPNVIYKMEIFMISQRMKQLISMQNKTNVLFDRCIFDSIVFCESGYNSKHIIKPDWETAKMTFDEIIFPTLLKSGIKNYFDVIFYLKIDTQKAIKRINERDAYNEKSVNLEYWDLLNNLYDKWYEILSKKFGNIVVIDANEDDIEVKTKQILDYIDANK